MIDVGLPAVELAPLLVGALFSDGDITVRLTEVEAYAGVDDPASHAWRGPRPATVAVASGPRVGVSVAYRRPWRFWAAGDPTVSAYRRSPRIVEGRLDW